MMLSASTAFLRKSHEKPLPPPPKNTFLNFKRMKKYIVEVHSLEAITNTYVSKRSQIRILLKITFEVYDFKHPNYHIRLSSKQL